MGVRITKDILAAARTMLDPEDKWARGHYAARSDGSPVATLDPDACRFCVVGAVARAAGVDNSKFPGRLTMKRISRYLSNLAAVPSIVRLNDGASHGEILAVLDDMIAKTPDIAMEI